jgi:hypothetical protein
MPQRRTFSTLLALALVLFACGRAAAQVATPAALAEHPIVGAWRWASYPLVSADPDPQSYAIFHADGTYQEVFGDQTFIGVWQTAGARGADVISHSGDIALSPDVFEAGTLTVRANLVVDETGNALAGTSTVRATAADGTVVMEAGPYTIAGIRLSISPASDGSEPAVATPISADGSAASGTVIAVIGVIVAPGIGLVAGACLDLAGTDAAYTVCDNAAGDRNPVTGTIELAEVAAGDYDLTVQPPPGFVVGGETPTTIHVEAGQLTFVVIHLFPEESPPTPTA